MFRRLDYFSPPPPPPPTSLTDQTLNLPKPRDSHSATNLSPSFVIIAVILTAVFLASVFIHLLLRYLNRRCNTFSTEEEDDDVTVPVRVSSINSASSNPISSRRVAPENPSSHKSLIESLPLFSFNSISAIRSSADCAVCLSRFEPHDQLRLLPICCHAFHSECIDTWLEGNHTCPLCRSSVHVEELDNYLKILSSERSSSSSRGSFRVEIGNVSSRRAPAASESDRTRSRSRSYSIGSFEYLVDESPPQVEVETNPAHRRGDSETVGKKDETAVHAPRTPGDDVAAEVSEGRGWLKDYMDRLASSSVSSSLSSRAMSFRFSGRFFTGSSRRSEAFSGSGRRSNGSVAAAGGGISGGSCDLEAGPYTEEIGNFFRWLSGV